VILHTPRAIGVTLASYAWTGSGADAIAAGAAMSSISPSNS
jgi:hypothetical protein